jgi:hypothetical protein
MGFFLYPECSRHRLFCDFRGGLTLTLGVTLPSILPYFSSWSRISSGALLHFGVVILAAL